MFFVCFTFVLRVLRMYICKIRHKRYRGERVFLEFLIDYREMMEMCVCVPNLFSHEKYPYVFVPYIDIY